MMMVGLAPLVVTLVVMLAVMITMITTSTILIMMNGERLCLFSLQNKVVTVDDYKVKLQIWDTAGQERFRSVTHAYYRDAHALLLLYDVSNKTSFDNTRAWLGEINEYAQDDVVIMLIGNKADIQQDRQVRLEDGERLAREYGVAFMETSAKTGCNVELAFMAVARELKQRSSRSAHGASGRFNMTEYIRQESQAKPNGCCSS
ncbi:hypothetical protein V5799_006234 [Amblyomma americanum]|uniref:Rab subfamily protein of small gtpase n=1 Tax=Amblyomma americanum TaxID=6943 RepID=A0AAQ4DWZ6_AMBAM